jgi:hypothetical protein
MANSIANDYILINTNFCEYSKYFETTSKDNFCGYKISIDPSKYKCSDVIVKMFHYKKSFYLLKWLNNYFSPKSSSIRFIAANKGDYEINNQNFINLAKKKVVFAYGWAFRDKKNFNKYSEVIRELLKPLQVYQSNINQLIQRCRKECDVLVGVHMRRGDYAKYANGRYFYHTDIYTEKMNIIFDILKSKNKKAAFLICSNEPFDLETFSKLKTFKGNNHIIEDMYSLAQCDYIIGPPSTYSGWASFYGKVPRCILRNKEQLIELDDFKRHYEISSEDHSETLL